VATDSAGNLYVSDQNNHRIRKITKSESGGNVTYTVSTIAGPTGANRPTGHADETGSEARFNNPYGVAVDKDGNLYVADKDNHRIRKITKSESGGNVYVHSEHHSRSYRC